ncbi:unnamed protein product [Protopolystoma xenopodis]|uniref:Uncharacterized protein n=1 Tax=Protopolystoma xenopodis TaxID=117903 RepID=A0A448WAI0_9PLAT|nr:unnamed protein product [Protopolystoma xenopodis]
MPPTLRRSAVPDPQQPFRQQFINPKGSPGSSSRLRGCGPVNGHLSEASLAPDLQTHFPSRSAGRGAPSDDGERLCFYNSRPRQSHRSDQLLEAWPNGPKGADESWPGGGMPRYGSRSRGGRGEGCLVAWPQGIGRKKRGVEEEEGEGGDEEEEERRVEDDDEGEVEREAWRLASRGYFSGTPEMSDLEEHLGVRLDRHLPGEMYVYSSEVRLPAAERFSARPGRSPLTRQHRRAGLRQSLHHVETAHRRTRTSNGRQVWPFDTSEAELTEWQSDDAGAFERAFQQSRGLENGQTYCRGPEQRLEDARRSELRPKKSGIVDNQYERFRLVYVVIN